MIIIPAIDIKDNKCVRLSQGRAEDVEVFFNHPVDVARRWQDLGAERLHLVDLDAAFQGKPVHHQIIKEIVEKTTIPVQVGGGIRNEETICRYLEYGVQWVVLGTALFGEKPEKIQTLIRQFGPHLIAGIDVKNNHIAIQGWTEETDIPVLQFMTDLDQMGFRRIIYTDIHRDGMLKGPNIEMINKISEKSKMKIIASGGISNMDDLYRLEEFNIPHLEGVIIGKALYRGKIKLDEAVNLFHSRKDG